MLMTHFGPPSSMGSKNPVLKRYKTKAGPTTQLSDYCVSVNLFLWPVTKLVEWYLFYFLFDLFNTPAGNAALASEGQTKVGVLPHTVWVFWNQNTRNTFV